MTGQDELDLSIVIPAYKEGAKIEADVRAAADFLQRSELRGEILVVDDGSPDDTADRAAALRGEFPNLIVLSYKPNRGKGHAVRHGVLRARGRIVMFADSGLCAPYDNAKIGIALIDMNMCDVAHGSRRVRGSSAVARPLWRRVGSTGFKWLSHTVMGIPLSITDTQCGFKLYRREAGRELYEAAFTDGYMFDTELIMRAVRSKWRLLEFPVIWTTDADSRYQPLSGQTVRNLTELAKLRYRFSPLGRASIPARQPVTERAFDSRVGTS